KRLAMKEGRRRKIPPPRREEKLVRQRVVLLQRGAQFGQRGIGIAAVLLDAVAPSLGQRLGSLLPQRDLLGRQLVDLVAGLRLDLVDAGVFHLAPELADLAGGLGVTIVVDRLLLLVGHLVVLVL